VRTYARHLFMLAISSCSPSLHARHLFMLAISSCSPSLHARHLFMLAISSCSPSPHDLLMLASLSYFRTYLAASGEFSNTSVAALSVAWIVCVTCSLPSGAKREPRRDTRKDEAARNKKRTVGRQVVTSTRARTEDLFGCKRWIHFKETASVNAVGDG